MKLHTPIFIAISSCLEQIFTQGFYADKVIERNFKINRQWGARDRKLVAESVYDIVRWFKKLRSIVLILESQEHSNIDSQMDPSLRQAFIEDQLFKNLTGSDFQKITALYFMLFQKDFDIQNLSEKYQLSKSKIEKIISNKILSFDQLESYPKWFYDLAQAELKEEWSSLSKALNEQAPVYIRTNTLKIQPEALLPKLRDEGFEFKLLSNPQGGLELLQKKNIFKSQAFQNGLFEVQDGASQMIAPMLDLKPGLRLIDACAGAGGKSLHAAQLMQNKGKILALDLYPKKLEELKIRSRRAGVDIIETRVIESSKVIKRLKESADRLLLDVPCSGLGVLKRNPDAKWKMKPERLEELKQIQTQILNDYVSMLKPGGILVYATCSILPSENELQIEKFLKNHPEFKLLEEKHFRPQPNSKEESFDGFYAAKLMKPNS